VQNPHQRYDRFRGLRDDPRGYLRCLIRAHRVRGEFSNVRAYCLFLGTPRSGHSLVGMMLNAHRNAVIAHSLDVPRRLAAGYRRNQLYWLILRRDRKFTYRRGSVGAGYDYAIPGQWQGRYESLEVIGHKRGGGASRAFAADPTLFERFARTVGVPMRVIHVVRHPYDSIATISIRHEMTLREAVGLHFGMLESADRVMRGLGERECITVHHEDFVAAPEQGLGDLCEFLGLTPYPGYIEDCAKIVWSEPRRSRDDVAWPPALREEVAERAARFPFLSGYAYDA